MRCRPGNRFLSGITYYTYSLIEALNEAGHPVLCRADPQAGAGALSIRAEPGWASADRSGPAAGRAALRRGRLVLGPVADAGVAFLRRERPQVLVLQWWTGAVLHTYLVLALVARLHGARSRRRVP